MKGIVRLLIVWAVIATGSSHVGAVAGDAGTESALPRDFAFLGLTEVDKEIDIQTALKGEVTMTIRANGDESLLSSGRDGVCGLRGKGLAIEQRNEGNVLNGTFRLHLFWRPEPFACYRDGKLLGIWDQSGKRLRAATGDEAAAEFPGGKAAEEPEPPEFRLWTSASGKHTTEARFVKFQDGRVHLEKRDGKSIQVPSHLLNKADQQYVRDTLRQRRER